MKFKTFAALLSSLVIAACGGGGGGGSSSSSSSGFSQTYSTSASAGELMTFSIDTTALTYSYTITKSSYGCEVVSSPCHSGSGTLTKNSDGSYTPSGSSSSRIFAIQNGLLVGAIRAELNGTLRVIPIIGVANPITTTSGLAGDFNFISMQCTSQSYGVFTGCSTYHGTVSIASNGTYTTCTGDNISAPSHTCTNTTSGSLTSLGSGVWQFQATSPGTGSTTNYLLAFNAPNGQKVGVMDFNDSTAYGYGQAVMSSIAATSTSGLAGRYVWNNTSGQAGAITLNADGTTSSGVSIAQNSPWNGLATVTGGGYGTGYGLVAGNGVYVYRNPNISSHYFEVGVRLQ